MHAMAHDGQLGGGLGEMYTTLGEIAITTPGKQTYSVGVAYCLMLCQLSNTTPETQLLMLRVGCKNRV